MYTPARCAVISIQMAKPSSKDRRKQLLKERQTEERRQMDREEADDLFRDAYYDHRHGDDPSADRILKRILILAPDHAPALNLLAEIHETAGHHAETLSYLRRLQKVDPRPINFFNLGVVYRELGQLD